MCYIILSKSITEAPSNQITIDKSKQEAYTGALLLFAKASAVKPYLYLCWTLIVQFWIQDGASPENKACLLNLAAVSVRVTGRTWLITDEFFDFVFSSCTLSIMQEPLGEQELLVNQSLMWKPQRPRQQNCFSLILHVFELRNQSPWMWLLREPCSLPQKKRQNEEE